MKYKPRRVWLLRGGKVLKFELATMSGEQYSVWCETKMFHPLTENKMHFADRDDAEFLNEEGQLKHKLLVQADHFTDKGCTVQDQLLTFLKEGVVHHPELFEAAMKGYNIDTSDFAINTAHNVRAMEGNSSV